MTVSSCIIIAREMGEGSPNAPSRLHPRGTPGWRAPPRARARRAYEADAEGARPGDELPCEVRVCGQAGRIRSHRFTVRLPPEGALDFLQRLEPSVGF